MSVYTYQSNKTLVFSQCSPASEEGNDKDNAASSTEQHRWVEQEIERVIDHFLLLPE
jgi:hypothetical protein